MTTDTTPSPTHDGGQLSAYGPFPASEEDVVLDEMLEYIRNEVRGIDHIVADYASFVGDPARVARADDLKARMADQGAYASLGTLIEVLYFAGRQDLLQGRQLRFPAYDIQKQFIAGSVFPQGPRFDARGREFARKWSLFGKPIRFPIGIPASVLTNNAEWISYFTRLGYSVITTRTVRSRRHDANVAPNWVFVPSEPRPRELDSEWASVVAKRTDWVDAGNSNVTTSNSFGVPSTDPEEWGPDLAETLNDVREHEARIVIVSVMGDVYDEVADEDEWTRHLVDDFVSVAKSAESYGAEFIELNLSCPNSMRQDRSGVKPPLCYEIAPTVAVISAVRAALRPGTRLIAKLSYLGGDTLRGLLEQAGALLDGISGINTIQARVMTSESDDGDSDEPTFPGRSHAGVSGVAIRNFGLDFVKSLVRLRLELDLHFEILGMGGVTDVESFSEMIAAGASVVQSASGVFANPFLAEDCMRRFASKSFDLRSNFSQQSDLLDLASRRISDVLPLDEWADRFDLAVRLALPGEESLQVVDALVERGELIDAGRGQLRLRG